MSAPLNSSGRSQAIAWPASGTLTYRGVRHPGGCQRHQGGGHQEVGPAAHDESRNTQTPQGGPGDLPRAPISALRSSVAGTGCSGSTGVDPRWPRRV